MEKVRSCFKVLSSVQRTMVLPQFVDKQYSHLDNDLTTTTKHPYNTHIKCVIYSLNIHSKHSLFLHANAKHSQNIYKWKREANIMGVRRLPGTPIMSRETCDMRCR